MRPVLFPAIDLLGGRAVRLHKGLRESAKVYADDPAAQARAFCEQGAQALHVVDLDAAFGERRQLELVAQIVRACGSIPVQVGGGVRDLEAAQATLDAGAARVIFGTAVAERPALAGEAVARFGAERVAVGIDVKEGKVSVRGWTESGAHTAAALAAQLDALGVRWLVVTAVARDGTLGGFDLALLEEVAKAAPRSAVIASGGAGSLEHLRALRPLPGLAGAIAGTALYERRFTIPEGQSTLQTGLDERRDAFRLSDDPALLQLDVIHAFLTRSYWSPGIPKETVARALAGSLSFGLYDLSGPEPRQAGFARCVTDRATFAYLADVFVLDAFRGRGLGIWMMERIAAHPDLQGLRRWMLATRDAHALYLKTGWTPIASPSRFMERLDAGVYQRGEGG